MFPVPSLPSSILSFVDIPGPGSPGSIVLFVYFEIGHSLEVSDFPKFDSLSYQIVCKIHLASKRMEVDTTLSTRRICRKESKSSQPKLLKILITFKSLQRWLLWLYHKTPRNSITSKSTTDKNEIEEIIRKVSVGKIRKIYKFCRSARTRAGLRFGHLTSCLLRNGDFG